MKKLLLVAITLTCLALNSQTQYDTIYVNGVPKITKKSNLGIQELNSPLKKDNYLYEFSFGVPFTPSREASIFDIGSFRNTFNYSDKKNLQHLCADVDYQLNDEFSVGLELTYAQTEFVYKRRYSYYTSGSSSTRDSLYTMSASKTRFLAKISYHFNISEKFDAFLISGFGYKQFKYSTNDSYLNSLNLNNNIIPLAIRFGVGGRFFLNKDIAIHVEGGIGGPLMQIGLTYKMQ